MQQRITASIDAKLGAIGWTPAPAPTPTPTPTADVMVAAHVVAREHLSIDSFGGGWAAALPLGQ